MVSGVPSVSQGLCELCFNALSCWKSWHGGTSFPHAALSPASPRGDLILVFHKTLLLLLKFQQVKVEFLIHFNIGK